MVDRRAFLRSVAAAGALAGASPRSALAADDPSRIALVVGNDDYSRSPLVNAVNDARAVADLLRTAEFRVDLRTDTPRDALAKAVEAFGAAIARPEVKLAVFYYAGHGTQVDWRNYLVPVDANVTSAKELAPRCFDLGVLLEQLAKTRNKVFVVILDACRDKPLGAAFQPERRGLSPFDAPAGTVLAFSTAPGAVASDGPGKHGLYTESLVRELAVRGARIEDAFKRVRLSVRLASGGAQIPWESTSLESDVFLFPAAKKLSDAELERMFEQELATWNRIKSSKDVKDWAAYLREHPNGKFSEIAQARLNALIPAPPVERPVPAPDVPVGGAGKPLELKAGTPVPDFYGSSGNPYSAGIYPLGRRFTVGDEATYAVLDPFSKVRQGLDRIRITKVDLDGDRVELNDGTSVSDLMGNMLKIGAVVFDAPAQVFPAELQLGKKWTARFRRKDSQGYSESDIDFQVLRREKVVVPAGEFDTFRIDGRGVGRHARGVSRLEVRIWVVPGVVFSIKREQFVDGGRTGGEILELVHARQHA
jgi:Caspase domain